MTPGIDRRDALKLMGGTLAALPLVSGAALPIRRVGQPNIIVITTDDQRQDAMGAYGNPILKTPNLDRIANEGARFDLSFVTNALCAPSRASLLTGLYSHAHGVITNGGGPRYYNQPGLRADQITLPHLLRGAGYHTALIGKWHIRSNPTGFDQWLVFPGQGTYQDPVMHSEDMQLKLRGHADDVVGDQALMFLQSQPRDRPFFLLYNFKSPHRSWMPAARHARAFEDMEVQLPRTFEDRLVGRPDALRKAELAIADMPDFRNRGVDPSLPEATRKRLNLEHLVKNYYRVLLSVDDNVGRVLDWLDQNQMAQDTIVVYTSDNGFFLGEHGLFDKRLMYEPSIKVPLAIRYPARFKPMVDREHIVLNIDVAPTLLETAGVPVPGWMHGKSMVPLLEQQRTNWRDAILYEYYEYPAEHCVRKNRGIRTQRWKLIHFWERPEEWELYDLTADPDETNNLAASRAHAGTVADLKARLLKLREEVGDRDPPGPAPVAEPCGGGVNTGYGPPR